MNKLLNVYWGVLLVTTILWVIFKNDKKIFVISAAIVHVFVSGFRHEITGGDLHAYHRSFLDVAALDWREIWFLNGGKNTLFFAFNKLIANISDNNFQLLLFTISLISIVSISVMIYRYSQSPLISFYLWSCFGFYIFTFSGIKQGLAMALIMFAALGIFEKKRFLFYSMAILAGLIHVPAFVFLPAYELCRARKMKYIVFFYLILFLTVLLLHNQIVSVITEMYYEGGKYALISDYEIGGKTLMMIGLLAVGVVMCNANINFFRYTFILLATAAILQMFSVYDNVFTRLSDYYFQFIILYAPFILKQPNDELSAVPILNFNNESRKLLSIGFIILAMVFYYRVNFLHSSAGDTPFRFFWQ